MHLLVGIACVVLSACCTQPFQGKIDEGKRAKYLSQGIDARVRAKDQPPQVGLALAGGGTKAADFSIGVLQGLTEAGVMERVDAVSTVSGGGYAALWYFSRLLNWEGKPGSTQGATQPLTSNSEAGKFFRDCIPAVYVKKYLDTLDGGQAPSRHAPGSKNTLSGPCPMSLTNYDTDKRSTFANDDVRYLNHLRGYQDIFAWDWNAFRYTQTTGDQVAAGIDFGVLVLGTIGSAALNVVPNLLFDWDIPMSVSRWRYETGIVRAFGATPTFCAKTPWPCKEGVRPTGSEEWVRKRLTFALLREEYEKGNVPLWIINTTAGENRDLIHFGAGSGQKPFQFSSFEFSPYGSGSGLFHYSEHALGDLSPWEAVTSSAAFLDSQQKVVVPIVNPLLKASTLDWGRTIRNPNVGGFKYGLHHLVPFPFYLWHGRAGAQAEDYVNIRLSDGGQSEDLGAYALVQRKVPDIIISDHSSDRSGRMEDVCRLKNGLEKEHGDDMALYVFFPGLEDLGRLCTQDLAVGGYDIFHWEHPILLGCVTSDPGNTKCDKAESQQVHFQRLYLIKPALPSSKGRHHLGKTLFELGNVLCKDTTECTANGKNPRRAPLGVPPCIAFSADTPYARNIPAVDSQEWRYEDYASCELAGFLIANASNEAGIDTDDGCPYFPQHDTKLITANSSPSLFGAYRELGRYYARQLGWFFGNGQGAHPVSEALRGERYRWAIEYQFSHQLPAKPISKRGRKAGLVGNCLN